MTSYQRGLAARTQVLPEVARVGLDRLAAYRAGLGDALAGAGHHYRRGARGVVGATKPTERAANWAMSAVHTGLLVFGLAAIVRV